MDEKIKKLKEIIDCSNNIVFFGGAGVSTESGVPDFRSADGLYNRKFKYPPETILSHDFFTSKTKEFFEFYKATMLSPSAMPNDAHYSLVELEKQGKLKAVVTQNIDGLHQKAGSRVVYELHGTVHKNRCMRCGKFYGVDKILSSDGIPLCDCGGIIKPEVVLYDEPLPDGVFLKAIRAMESCDTLIVAGTSLTVYPAADLLDFFNGDNLVLINRDATGRDDKADLVIHDKVGVVLSQAVGLKR